MHKHTSSIQKGGIMKKILWCTGILVCMSVWASEEIEDLTTIDDGSVLVFQGCARCSYLNQQASSSADVSSSSDQSVYDDWKGRMRTKRNEKRQRRLEDPHLQKMK